MTLEPEEEECLVLQDRPADRTTKLILPEWRTSKRGSTRTIVVVEVVVRVQDFVPQVLVCSPMELIGSRLRREVDDSSRVAAILGRNIVRHNTELLHDILRWNQGI